MDRFEELKKKGWKNLSGDERKEFQKLNVAVDYSAKIPEQNTLAEEDDKITISASELDAKIAVAVAAATQGLQQTNKKLEQQIFGGCKETKPTEKPNKMANMRLYRADGDAPYGIVIDWHFLKNVEDELTHRRDKPVYKITVQYDDETKGEFELPLIEFAQIADYETVDIIKEIKTDLVKSFGKVFRAAKNREGYTMTSNVDGSIAGTRTGQMVEMEEHRDEIVCTIKRPNGNILVLNANRLNG